jgi:hypothetical protein
MNKKPFSPFGKPGRYHEIKAAKRYEGFTPYCNQCLLRGCTSSCHGLRFISANTHAEPKWKEAYVAKEFEESFAMLLSFERLMRPILQTDEGKTVSLFLVHISGKGYSRQFKGFSLWKAKIDKVSCNLATIVLLKALQGPPDIKDDENDISIDDINVIRLNIKSMKGMISL